MDYSVKAWLLFAVTMVVWAGPARSAVIFTVGDNTGWTSLNNPNYTQWATGKTFRVGDTLQFKYSKQFHNVLEVKEADFTACKNSTAIKEYKTGEDSIIIKSVGHHYFICGFPGHCQSGQKVDILAVGSSDAPSSSPSGLSPPPQTNVGNQLAAEVSVFVDAMIVAAVCAIALFGF